MKANASTETALLLKTAFVLDEVWPEYESYLGSVYKRGDQLLAPGVFGKAWLARYGWGPETSHAATVQTIGRHIAMRRVAAEPGAVRQQAYLKSDHQLATTLAKRIDYRARHLVVAQTWLPWLADLGVLGGRSYDVVMSRYPLAEVHRRLDEAALHFGPSTTIADFRADATLVALEKRALDGARKIITPHHGIANLFSGRSMSLAWHRPPASSARKGRRVAFLGPTIARQRADLVREIARTLPQPMIVMGADLEGPDFWAGIRIERRKRNANWLDDVGTILHPAAMTNQPRALLQALANGVRVVATDGCGLARPDFETFDHFSKVNAAMGV